MNESYEAVVGTWTGEKELFLTPDPEDVRLCNAKLTVEPVARGRFMEMRYAWSYKGEAQEGLLIFGVDMNERVASGAWVDTWHQSGRVMALEGTPGAGGEADMEGRYAAPPGPDWGWRILVHRPVEDRFLVEMFNRSPEGQEDLAVRLRLVRTPLA